MSRMSPRERKERWYNPKHTLLGTGDSVKALLWDPTVGQRGEGRNVSADWGR